MHTHTHTHTRNTCMRIHLLCVQVRGAHTSLKDGNKIMYNGNSRLKNSSSFEVMSTTQTSGAPYLVRKLMYANTLACNVITNSRSESSLQLESGSHKEAHRRACAQEESLQRTLHVCYSCAGEAQSATQRSDSPRIRARVVK